MTAISRLAVFGSLLVAGVLVVIAATAMAQQANNTFYACAKGDSIKGTISVDAQPRCAGSQRLVSWNAEGPDGPSGVSGYEIVRDNASRGVGVDSSIRLSVFCPDGKSVLGGGVAGSDTSWLVHETEPRLVSDGWPANGWHGKVTTPDLSKPAGAIHVWAICSYATE